MTKIKICGLRRMEDIEAVNQFHPDYVGFVFAKSKRQVSMQEAEILSHLLAPEICPVGVFVDAPIHEICEIVDRGIIQAVQLHGQEDESYIQVLKKTCAKEVPIIRAVRMEPGHELEKWRKSSADMLLLDAGSGGTGNTFDHDLLSGQEPIEKKWFLAGGMNPDNVEAAILRFHPHAIDCSSGVETDGWKDLDKIKKMIEKTRQL